MKMYSKLVMLITLILTSSCATYNPQFKNPEKQDIFPTEKEIEHTFFLIGNTNSEITSNAGIKNIEYFANTLSSSNNTTTTLILGNAFGNETKISQQKGLDFLNNYQGKSILIPGVEEWKMLQIPEASNFLKKELDNTVLLPNNNCPLSNISISEHIELITIDSQWYIANWDKYPSINSNCDIKNRTDFFKEFENLLLKHHGKRIIVAIHHPLINVGKYGGFNTVKSHLVPIPFIGSLKNVIRKTSGLSPKDLEYPRYLEMTKKLKALTQQHGEIIFVSGHDKSLQLNKQGNVAQIISGSGTVKSATKLQHNTSFSYGELGFARLDLFKDGSSFVRFYTDNKKPIYESTIFETKKQSKIPSYTENPPIFYKSAIYDSTEVNKSKFHRTLWGDRYRKDYGTKVNVRTALLDTLFGGLKPIRIVGAEQTKVLKLKSKDGKEYVMRALRKKPLQFLQEKVLKNQKVNGKNKKSFAENSLQDIFTGLHPYAPFVIGTLADAIDIYHPNPKLYYIPKQKALGQFNTSFGDELYMVSENPSPNHSDVSTFGNTNTIISTHKMLRQLEKSPKHQIDEVQYIRGRIFDMLVGDWDRAEHQWRWGVFKKDDTFIYKPIPIDKDHAFSMMDDGAIGKILSSLDRTFKPLRSYKEDITSVKWFNNLTYTLDMALINRADKKVWDEQLNTILNNIDETLIDKAFLNFPKEIDQHNISTIKTKLLGRLKNLPTLVNDYYNYLNKYQSIRATNQDDFVEIIRIDNCSTTINIYESSNKKTAYFSKNYASDITKEIWIYGLDGADHFETRGQEKGCIQVRIIGGQNNDIYTINNNRKISIYDYKSQKNTFKNNNAKVVLTDNYKTNVYNYQKVKTDRNQLIPKIAFNPDNGLTLGVTNIFTHHGIQRNPYTSRHSIYTAYFFATNGFDLKYNGSFANVLKNLNLEIDAAYASPNYSQNFFGFGNNTPNPNHEDENVFSKDYNRVRIEQYLFEISLVRQGKLGSRFSLGTGYANYTVEDTQNRIVNSVLDVDPSAKDNNFVYSSAKYSFKNQNKKSFATLGMSYDADLGMQYNLKKNHAFPYFKNKLSFDHSLFSSDKIVLATAFGGEMIFNDNFEFYQSANIGANNGLRGYRNERFSGKHSFYHSSDIRYQFRQTHTGILPVSLGCYIGYDYGRIWTQTNPSNKWNHSYGGGLFVNMANIAVGNLSVFTGNEEVRVAFKLGFDF